MAISSQEQRRAVCFYVAGRAVIHALAGAHVYRVAVAPMNSPNWTYEPRKGSVLTGFDGYCEASDVPEIHMNVRWDDQAGRFVGYREGFETTIENRRSTFNLLKPEFRTTESAPSAEQYLEAWRELARAHVAARWAGPMAQLIHVQGQFDEQDARDDLEFEHDISVADGIFQLLPEDGPSHILRTTETSLREPAVWQQVNRLADVLGQLGEVGRGLNEYLPEPRAGWMQGLAPDVAVAGPRVHE